MKLRLPHPKSLNVLPSPTNKWSATTHPIKGWTYRFIGYHILYKHFYFHDNDVLLTKAFAPKTTATTVGNGGNPRRSTELDEMTGHNCATSQDKYHSFTLLLLGLRPDKNHGTKQSESSFVNMLLEDFVSLTNLTAVLPSMNPQTGKRLRVSLVLACYAILLLGTDALTPTIIQAVWGENKVVQCNLGGPHGNLAII
jgi:hypothetical protein